ncbi:baculoviral IAP repeat-containing protein 3-like [Penaeus japonicus]|uniref:baculoviral IAP repeat-containing protein 3-like n=2 Tax=Penaeus japonicus TaxID=27405 RepID=UPI001C7158D5|nr:baculoviral IAP repeat-containing protein 3-like [Penaeus japonicus]
MEDKESNCNIYQHEDKRWDSFNHYYYIDPRLLAKAGFFFSKNDDIQCFTCDLELDMKTLTSTDDIINIHKERSPKCSFAQSLYGFENILKFLKLPIRKTYEYIHENLNQEKVRLSTFIDWPLEWLSPSSLAADGFYYTRREDRVKCVFCRKEISGFKKGCIIGEEHKRLSPNCHFVNGSSTSNIPIKFYSIEGMLWHNIRKHQPSISSSYPYSAIIHDNSWRGKFSTIKERLASFENWPDCLVQKPLDLANAGFFYEGANDYVRCFHCYGGLYNWEKGDIPWNEHAKWYPKCQHIKSERGIEFIHTIEEEMKRKPAMDPDDILMELDIVKCVRRSYEHNVPIFLSYFDTSYGYEDRPITYICREDDYIIGIPYQSCSKKEYSTIEKRLASFKKWPDCLVQKPQDLAEAGLYYEGVGDYVRCFQCSGGHCNWEKEDIPWNLHARWRPDCLHLYLKKGIEFIKNENDKALDRDRDEIDRCELLWELDIVKCVVSMGYSINIAKETIKKHVNETGWPYLRLDEYIDDMDQMLIKNPKIMKPKPPSIISHIISETKDAYIQSLRSKIESKFSTTSNDILNATLSHESENTENPTSLEALPETENIENPTSLEALPEAENMECDIEILQTDQDPTEEWMKYISGKHVTDEHRKEETKTPEQKRDNPKCEVCKNKNAKVLLLPCTHMVACESCVIDLPIDILRVLSVNVVSFV